MGLCGPPVKDEKKMGGPFKPAVGLSGVFGADVQVDVFRPERSEVERSAVRNARKP